VRFWKRGKPNGHEPPQADLGRLELADGPPKGPENFVVRTGLKLPQAHWDLVNGKVKLTP
jgi:hypothetical protein